MTAPFQIKLPFSKLWQLEFNPARICRREKATLDNSELLQCLRLFCFQASVRGDTIQTWLRRTAFHLRK
jgi:hypothetical protein